MSVISLDLLSLHFNMDKQSIRSICKKNRNHKSLIAHFNDSSKIQTNLFFNIDFSKYKNVFIYLSSLKMGEIDTWDIISKLKSNNIFIPKIINNEIKIAKYDSNKFSKSNHFGIFECNEIVKVKIDIAIIPMLSFNKNLYRIGYGGGYYDRFLKNNNCFKIGLCSDIMRNWNEEKHDISMNIIITPNKIYNCLLL